MLKKLIILLIITRIALFVYAGSIMHFAGNWDGSHYVYISQHGYVNLGDESNFIVFLPLYPAVISTIDLIVGNSLLGSILLSNISFVFAGVVFYKLLKQHYSEKFSFFVVFLMAIFPTSFFFSSSYPESLFILLFCLSFYLFDNNQTVLSSMTAGLATLTRPFGILMWPALTIEAIKSKKMIRIPILIIFSVLFVSIYLAINYFVYNDIFAFQKILKDHWQKSFAFPWQGIYQSWRVAVLSTKWGEYRIYIGLAEAITSTVAWIFVPLSFYKKLKIRLSWAVYYLLGVIFFTSTGFILSAPRYLLSLPPFFLILASILKRKTLRIAWVVISMALLFYLTGIAVKGQWAF